MKSGQFTDEQIVAILQEAAKRDERYVHRAGKPWQNGLAESLYARLRDELLDGDLILSMIDTHASLSIWRHC